MSDIVLYTAKRCPYCVMAKKLLERKGAIYAEIDVDGEPELRQMLMEKTKRRTVPQIYIGDFHVGGFDDLNALEQQGKLDALLMG